MRAITILSVLGALAGSARAEITLAIGTKWLPVTYTQAVSTSGGAATGTGIPNSTPLKGWNSTQLDGYGGAFILDGKLGFLLGLDLGYASQSTQIGNGPSVDLSYVQFGLLLGAKYYLLKPAGQRVSPYVYLDFYKYFASVSTNATGVPKGAEDFIAGLASPLGIHAAGGAEYFFTPAFSLGAEIIGLRYAYASGSMPNAGAFGGGPSQTTHLVSFYTGLSLNYRIPVGPRARATEEEPEPARVPSKRGPRELPREERPESQPPPSEPPPKGAEPVD